MGEMPQFETFALDSLNLKRLDVFKIDTEGYELPVLNGVMRTIAEFKPKIIIEVH